VGLFEVDITVSNPAAPERSVTPRLLVDTGATLSWVPRSTLESIGIEPVGRRTFVLADGRRVDRETGVVALSLDGVRIGATAVFAEEGDGAILGATALEALGVMVDPAGKKLLPHDLMALSARGRGQPGSRRMCEHE
jgi:clan AA aspartic protease